MVAWSQGLGASMRGLGTVRRSRLPEEASLPADKHPLRSVQAPSSLGASTLVAQAPSSLRASTLVAMSSLERGRLAAEAWRAQRNEGVFTKRPARETARVAS